MALMCRDRLTPTSTRQRTASDAGQRAATRVVSEAQISTLMETSDLRAAVDGLIQATLDAGAPDNVTVLIAEAFR